MRHLGPAPHSGGSPRPFVIPRTVAPLLAALLLAVGCAAVPAAPGSAAPSASATASSGGGSVPASSSTPASTSVSPSPASPSPASPSTAAAFPVTLTDDEGTRTTLPAEPERVVSLSPANTETVFALGEGAKLVGGTDADDFPAEAKALPDVATYQGVLVEKVVDLEPDLVLAAGNNFTPPADIDRLRKLKIPVIVLYPETVDEVLADINLIGQAVGATDEAAEMTRRLSQAIDSISTAARSRDERPRVFYELGDQPEIYGPADDSFIADLITLAGGDPITTGSPTAFSIPLEKLVAADPEVIVLGDANYGVTPEAVKARPGGWKKMTAVREDRIHPVDDIIVTRPGPRLAEGLATLARAIHPDLQLPSASP